MLNAEKLPTIIDGQGLYLTRDGREVKIQEVKDSPRIATNNCHGHYARVTPSGRTKWVWNIWSPEGRFKFIGEHPLDIVRKLTCK